MTWLKCSVSARQGKSYKFNKWMKVYALNLFTSHTRSQCLNINLIRTYTQYGFFPSLSWYTLPGLAMVYFHQLVKIIAQPHWLPSDLCSNGFIFPRAHMHSSLGFHTRFPSPFSFVAVFSISCFSFLFPTLHQLHLCMQCLCTQIHIRKCFYFCWLVAR